MRVFIKRNVGADSTAFVVCDDNGYDKYKVYQNSGVPYSKYLLCGTQGEKLLTIRALSFDNFCAFGITLPKDRFAISAACTSDLLTLRFFGVSWNPLEVRSHCFKVTDFDGSVVMEQQMSDLPEKKGYTLDIYSEKKELYCIAAAVCIDVLGIREPMQTVPI